MKMKSKNNWTMRAAVLMFALVLITSSFVGGTFAKYVTEGSGGDTARVAKFGVEITTDADSMFKTSYDRASTSTGITSAYSVESSDTDNLVAPGTKGDNAMSFSLKGVPEVAVNVSVQVSGMDVVLKKGSGYMDMTTADNLTDTFDLAKDYYPVVYTLKQGTTDVAKGTINDINTYFAGLSKDYDPKTNLTTTFGDYTLSWEWKFEDNSDSTIDKADTLLGNLATGVYTNTDLTDDDKYPKLGYKFDTGLQFTITAKVTQID